MGKEHACPMGAGLVSTGTVEPDPRRLKDGDNAGFGIFESPYGYIAVQKDGAQNKLIMVNNGKTIDRIMNFNYSKIWVRAAAADKRFVADFSYGINGKIFKSFGNQLKRDLAPVVLQTAIDMGRLLNKGKAPRQR